MAVPKKLSNRRARLMNLQHRAQLLSAFGNRVQQLRIAAGLTPGQFEARSGIDAGNLAKYEQGDREPGLIVIIMLARALGVQPWELFDVDGDVATKGKGIHRSDLTSKRSGVGLVTDPITVLRSLMKEKRLRSKDLVEILGVSKGLVSNILSYRKGLSKKNIRLLAEYFEVDQEVFNRGQ